MRLVICSKSTWSPSIRREHAVARSAAQDGHPVVFIERPLDVRAIGSRRALGAWLGGFRPQGTPVATRIEVMRQSTVVPGHRSALAQSLDAVRLGRALRAAGGTGRRVVVATQPWQWPAVATAPAARRVFDCADDWRLLIPGRAEQIDALYRRIATEADALVLTSSELAAAFAGGEVTVVGNGAGDELMSAPSAPVPDQRRMLYAGTLSERFDSPFLMAVLERLPDWSLELYGECQYAGHGREPGPDLAALLGRFAQRARWYGPVERDQLAGVLDRARVLIAPQRAALSRGQDSMKLYDYAARDRPIVCTPGALGSRSHIEGAGVLEAATPPEFAAAVSGAFHERPGRARRQWLDRNSWAARWLEWSRAAFGTAGT
jgi:Glycosyl transferases group 1